MKTLVRPPTKRRQVITPGGQCLVGGVNSPVRAFRQVGAEPLVLTQGDGAEVVDERGRRYLDFIMGWGALILGHNHPGVAKAIAQTLRRDPMVGLTHPAERELAARIAGAVPSVEQVRFTTSGTEACMTAIRLARAQTGRSSILTFDGCYHGHSDSALARKSAGIPAATEQETLTIPFNDLEALDGAVQRWPEQIACVIVEPVAANMGVVVPESGYLERLREATRQHGILLIFDEVVTGFRLQFGVAQERLGIRPDLTVFGKIIGGGLPIGAVGGPRRLMERLAPEGDVFHGGTFAGHPLSMAAGMAALKELKRHPPYRRLEALSQRLAEGVRSAADRAGVPIQINRAGSMLTVFFSDVPVRNVAHAKASRLERFARWANALRAEGVLVPPSPFETLFLSAAHTEAHVDRFIRASEQAFRQMRSE